jgi:hypothetical protein
VTHPTREEQKELIQKMEEAGRELDRIRRDALRGMPYRWEDVDALLELGDHYDGPPRLTSGLVEMQRIFIKAAMRSPRGTWQGRDDLPEIHALSREGDRRHGEGT